MLLAHKQRGRKNELPYKAGADDWIGNRALVIWVPEPYPDVRRALYRFRLATVSNARLFCLAFMLDGKPLPFQLIGDGGLLERAWPVADCFPGTVTKPVSKRSAAAGRCGNSPMRFAACRIRFICTDSSFAFCSKAKVLVR